MLGFRGGASVAAVYRDPAAYATKEKQLGETVAHPAAKGHREHRPVSETGLGRKPFNPDWEIFREL